MLFADALFTDPDALWFPTVFALISVAVVDYVPDQLLRPDVSGRSLHVGLIMLVYLLLFIVALGVVWELIEFLIGSSLGCVRRISVESQVCRSR